MSARKHSARGLAGALLLLGAWAAELTAELTPQEARGKTIYLEGTSPSGEEIIALMGDAATEVPASVIPCGSCHGGDGRGRPEGGVTPSNLTWPVLTKPYSVDRADGRRHPPYTERLLKRAVTMGIDPAGNPLHVAMPRYRLSLQDADDLVAYIQRLGEELDPGLSERSIAIATQLPQEGPMASLGGAIEAVLRAYFDEVNHGGGIYSRSLELHVEPAPLEPAERADALRRLVEAGETFALMNVFFPGADQQLANLVHELEIPLIGPFTLHPELDVFDWNPYVFYLLPGLEDLARSLVLFAKGNAAGTDADGSDEAPRSAVLTGARAGFWSTAETIVDQIADLGWPAARVAASGGVKALAKAGIDQVFVLASGDEQAAFLRAAASLGWYPRIFLPGMLAGRGVFEAPVGFEDKIFLAYPTLPSSQDPRSVREYRELAERYGLPHQHRVAQAAALGAAKVLVEGLKRSGRNLSRERLIEVLEGLVEHDTGLMPPITYGPNRRVGVRGAFVVAVGLAESTLVPASGFIRTR